MILGIDASNIRAGGGVTHLVEVLRHAEPLAQGFTQVVVWSGRATLDLVGDRPWLVKSHQRLLDRSLLHRAWWQRFRLSELARAAGCDVLLVPGGSYAGSFRPVVAMSQNLLPFEWRELRRYGWSRMTLRFVILRWLQSSTFRCADGLIFLTQYARDVIMRVVRETAGSTAIIPHGVDERFACEPREQLAIERYSGDRPFRILYVSIIEVYKHQWLVAEAVAQLRASGMPVVLDLVGPAYPPALKRLRQVLDRLDPTAQFLRYLGPVPNSELHALYTRAELCLFASSCETFSIVLLEGMASGLPMACSHGGPMLEILGDAGAYFDPENPVDIARALRELIESPALRTQKARASFDRAQTYSWARCADDTFRFLSKVGSVSRGLPPDDA
jgi:glycosyltransferase involved in cell wall biosynthesis